MPSKQELEVMRAFGVDTSALVGLTDWASGPPPSIGWWNVRFLGNPKALKTRRWWNGECWSKPVLPGFHSEEEAKELMQVASLYGVASFEWRGLKNPEFLDPGYA